jgi:hypothetical protein
MLVDLLALLFQLPLHFGTPAAGLAFMIGIDHKAFI